MSVYWTLFLLFIILILCFYSIFLKKFSRPVLLCQLKYFIAYCPACQEIAISDNDLLFNKTVAAFWHNKPILHFPLYPAIQKLKRKLFAIKRDHNEDSVIPVAILNELKNKPNDPIVNNKLLNFYLNNGRLHEAYNKAFQTKINFVPDLFWYQSCVQLCMSYENKFPALLDEKFYGNYLTALERTVALSVQDVKMPYRIIPEAVAHLASFDEFLYKVSTLKNPSIQFLGIIGHMRGQLYFNTALILYRKAKQEDLNWSEMMKSIAPLLSYSTAKCFDLHEVKKDEKFGEILNICIPVSIYRIHQAGYMLDVLSRMSPEHFKEQSCHISSNWKHRICEILYNTSNYRNVLKASAFMEFNETSIALENLPRYTFDGINQFLSVSESIYPSSLHHLVWIGVQYLFLNENSICDSVLPVNYGIKFTRPLKFSLDSSSSYLENLSEIDLEAFLFACVYCAKSKLDRRMNRSKPQFSNILPADVSELLCSPEQIFWWNYVNQTIAQDGPCDEAKSLIRKGIENIRLIGHHVLPLQLLVLLGRTFANKAGTESDSSQANELKYRARLYWDAALLLLKSPYPTNRLSVTSESMFEYQGNVTLGDAARLIFEGSRFVETFETKEKSNANSIFLEEGSNNPKTAAASTAVLSPYSADDTSLKSLLEQNTILMDKLEELSSIQIHQIDDVLVTPAWGDSDGEHPASYHMASQTTDTNVNQLVTSSAASVTTAPLSTQPAPTTNSSASFLPFHEPEKNKSGASTVNDELLTDFASTTALPDVAGEKEKKILFENRAKLYRSHFFEEVWIEQGVGQLQILKHEVSGNIRILMLLEDVHEICADHFLLSSMELTAKGDRGWVYHTVDHVVEKQALYAKLCVKFQTPEIANEFYRVFNMNKPADPRLTESSNFFPFQPTTPFLSAPLVPVTDGAKGDGISAYTSYVPNATEKTATFKGTPAGNSSADRNFTVTAKVKETSGVNDATKTPSAFLSGSSLNEMSLSEGKSKLFSSATVSSSALAKSKENNSLSLDNVECAHLKNDVHSSASTTTFSTPVWVKNDNENSTSFDNFKFTVDTSYSRNNTDGSTFAKRKGFKRLTKSGFPIFDVNLAQTDPPPKNMAFSFGSSLKNSKELTESVPKFGNFMSNAKPVFSFEAEKKKTVLIDDKNKTSSMSSSCSDNKLNFHLPTTATSSTPVEVKNEQKSSTSISSFNFGNAGSFSCLNCQNENFKGFGTNLAQTNPPEKIVNFSSSSAASAVPTTTVTAPPSLAVMLENFLSRWKCEKCYVANKKERTVCVACHQPKNGAAQPDGSKATSCETSGRSFELASNPVLTTTSSHLVAKPFIVPATATTSVCSSSSSTTVSITMDSCRVSASVAPPLEVGNSSLQQVDSCNSPVGTSNSSVYSKNEPSVPSKSCDNGVKSANEVKCKTGLQSSPIGVTPVTVASLSITSTASAVTVPASTVATSSASSAQLFSIGKETAQKSVSQSRRLLKGVRRNCNGLQDESTSLLGSNEDSIKSTGRMHSQLNFGSVAAVRGVAASSSFGVSAAPTTNGFSFSMSTSSHGTKNNILTTTGLSENGTSTVPVFTFGDIRAL